MIFFQIEVSAEIAYGGWGGVVEGDLLGSSEYEIFGDFDTNLG